MTRGCIKMRSNTAYVVVVAKVSKHVNRPEVVFVISRSRDLPTLLESVGGVVLVVVFYIRDLSCLKNVIRRL